jgi:hypothetical protein
MTIAENQLEGWSSQGAITNSIATHTYVRNALATHTWPPRMKHEVYLQGSYANSTNIRGDSDVDVVAECTSIFYSNLNDAEKQRLGLDPGSHSFADFRREVIAALETYRDRSRVDPSGANAIEVIPPPNSNRLKADVLASVTYKRYDSLKVIAEGLTFWNQQNQQQIINYPKLHIRNGEQKNANGRTNGWYKQSIRVFKNARTRIIDGNDDLRKGFPSYFVECLFYNVPDHLFGYSFQRTYAQAVDYLAKALSEEDAAKKFTTQSGQHWLFGSSSIQWSLENAREFISRLIKLWNA